MKIRFFRKILLFFLSLIPIHAISYAIEYNDSISSQKVSRHEIEDLFVNKLVEGSLSEDYYIFFDRFGVRTVEDLYKRENEDIKNRALDIFVFDLNHLLDIDSGGASSEE